MTRLRSARPTSAASTNTGGLDEAKPRSCTPLARASGSALVSASPMSSPSSTWRLISRSAPGVDAGQLEQVVDHEREAVGLPADLGVVAADRRAVGDHPVLQRLGHCPQAGQRGAQVVADPGDELAAARLQRPLTVPCLGQPAMRRRPARPTGPASSAGSTASGASYSPLRPTSWTAPSSRRLDRRHPPPDQQGDGEPGDAADDHDRHDHVEVGLRDEHLLRDHHRRPPRSPRRSPRRSRSGWSRPSGPPAAAPRACRPRATTTEIPATVVADRPQVAEGDHAASGS